jgi:hypothetical protein
LEQIGRHYEQLSAEERATVMLMRGEGCSLRAMARKLHRAPSTISRELVRNTGESGSYDARAAGIRARGQRFCGCRLRIVDLACVPPAHAGGGGVHFFSELHRSAALALVLGGRELTLPSVGPVDRSVFTRARGDSWRETYEQAGIRVRLSYRPGRSTCPVGREDGCAFLDVEADVEITVKGEPPRFHRAVGTCGC